MIQVDNFGVVRSQEDFSKESGSVIEFVNPYFGNEATREFRIEYTDYNWTLNDLSSKKN